MPGRMLKRGSGPVSVWCVPNLLSIARILAVPLFVWIMLSAPQDTAARWWAFAVFALAMVTDSLDGYLARSRNLITNVGKLIDPIADKALTSAAFIVLSMLAELPWWVTIVILIREFGITLWRLAVAGKRVLPAGRGGKLKTIVQSVAIALAIAPLAALLGDWMIWVNTIVMSAAFVLTVVTGADYLIRAYGPAHKRA